MQTAHLQGEDDPYHQDGHQSNQVLQTCSSERGEIHSKGKVIDLFKCELGAA